MRFSLFHPVAPRHSRVQDAIVHIPRHLLRANQHAFDLRVIDSRKVRPAAGRDIEAGAAEQINRRILEASFGNAKLELHALYTASGSYVFDSNTFHSPDSS